MLEFVVKYFRKYYELLLLIIWVLFTLGGLALGLYFGIGMAKLNSDFHIIGGIIGGFLGITIGFFVGLFFAIINGGLVATFLSIHKKLENIEKNTLDKH